MLAQYFYADTYKNQPAEGFDSVLEKMPEFLADQNSCIGKCKCYQTYNCRRQGDRTGDK